MVSIQPLLTHDIFLVPHLCDCFCSTYVVPSASPEVAHIAPNVVNTPSMVNTPNAAYTPTMYIANPTANPDPMFFNMGAMYGRGGMGGYGFIGSNNMGGKVKFMKNHCPGADISATT